MNVKSFHDVQGLIIAGRAEVRPQVPPLISTFPSDDNRGFIRISEDLSAPTYILTRVTAATTSHSMRHAAPCAVNPARHARRSRLAWLRPASRQACSLGFGMQR